MEEFDPATVLRNLRNRTPTRPMPIPPTHAPEIPPRPDSAASNSKSTVTDARVKDLEAVLSQKTSNEQFLKDENKRLKEMIRILKEDKQNSEYESQQKLVALQDEVERLRRLTAQLRGKLSAQALKEDRPKTPQRAQPPKPERDSLDLSPLVELFKKMPDFPRPILQIDFSTYIALEESL